MSDGNRSLYDFTNGWCAWSFKYSADTPYVVGSRGDLIKDNSFERYKALISKFGLNFPQETKQTRELNHKLLSDPKSLTHDDFKGTGYPFIESDRGAVIKLMTGHVQFTPAEREALDGVIGDFFTLDGRTKYKNSHLETKASGTALVAAVR